MYMLPLLYHWNKILLSASKIELSFRDSYPPQTSLSKFPLLSKYLKIDETIIEDRIEEVTSLIKEVEDVLKERCSLLFDENFTSK